MKVKLLALLFLFGLTNKLKAQDFSFGIKGGLLFDFSTQLLKKSNTQNKIEATTSGISKLSYQAGLFSKLTFPFLFLQPEAQLSSLLHEFEKKNNKLKFSFRLSSINLLCALGMSFFEFYKIYLAPTFSYFFQNKINLPQASKLKSSKWATGFLIGLGAQFSFLTLDLRYQQALSTTKNAFAHKEKNYAIEAHPSLFICSLGIMF